MKYNILHIGSHDGDDGIYSFVLENKEDIESIVLVDANPLCIEATKNQYKNIPNCFFECFAVLPICIADSKIKLYYPTNDDKSQVTSISEEFVSTHCHGSNIDYFETKTISLKNILKKYPDTNFLSIDTEGLDFLNLFSLDSSDFSNIQKLTFEYLHTDGTLSNGGIKLNLLLNFLNTLGFEKFNKRNYNIECEK